MCVFFSANDRLMSVPEAMCDIKFIEMHLSVPKAVWIGCAENDVYNVRIEKLSILNR